MIATIGKAIGGSAFYTGMLLVIDHQARELIRLVWQEVVITVKQLAHWNSISGENSFVASEN